RHRRRAASRTDVSSEVYLAYRPWWTDTLVLMPGSRTGVSAVTSRPRQGLRRNPEAPCPGRANVGAMASRIVAASASLVVVLCCAAPASPDAVSAQHLDDLRNGYRALTKTFYRGVEPAKLLAGARGGIAAAYRKAGRTPPAFASAREGGDALAQIVAAVEA